MFFGLILISLLKILKNYSFVMSGVGMK